MQKQADALRHILTVAYGEHHLFITPLQKKNRGLLYKLINLFEQLELIEHVNVFELGFRCPELLGSYNDCLRVVISTAREKGADLTSLALAEQAHQCILEIFQEVTHSYGQLS